MGPIFYQRGWPNKVARECKLCIEQNCRFVDLYVLVCFVLFNDMDEKCLPGHIEPVKHNNAIF